MANIYSAYYSSACYSDLPLIEDHTHNEPGLYSRYDVISLLSLLTAVGLDMIRLIWDNGMPSLGYGGTSTVSQGVMRETQGMAFKRVGLRQDEIGITGSDGPTESRVYRALISEVILLTHEAIRDHPNFVNVEGICWEINDAYKNARILPVLISRRAPHGDLENYAQSQGRLELEGVIGLFSDVVGAVEHLHSCRRSFPTPFSSLVLNSVRFYSR